MDGGNASISRTGRKSADLDHARIICSILFDGYRGAVAVKLWDDSYVLGEKGAPCTVTFHDPGVLRNLVLGRDLVRAAESYLVGRADIDGNVETLFELVDFLQQREKRLALGERWALFRHAFSLPGSGPDAATDAVRASKAAARNSRESIAHHYDVGNEFYRLFLDPQLVYSCAYFRDERQSLTQAQTDKLDLLCRKLRLREGDYLLDIGCGWGALVIHAARHYRARAHGITLSEQQHALANERLRELGLEDRVRVELRDYRDLEGKDRYDKVVSVGMFEHIGPAAYPEYFGVIKRVLRPGGLLCNHGIVNDTGWKDTPVTRFLKKYVFPDGSLARISEVITAMENAGFEILDAESLRRHYAMTLRHWVRNLEANHRRAVELVGEATYRVWRLYMSGSAHYFEQGGTNIFQVLAGHARSTLEIPLTREDIYAGPGPGARESRPE